MNDFCLRGSFGFERTSRILDGCVSKREGRLSTALHLFHGGRQPEKEKKTQCHVSAFALNSNLLLS